MAMSQIPYYLQAQDQIPDQPPQMAAPPMLDPRQAQEPVNPHDTLTAPLGPMPQEPKMAAGVPSGKMSALEPQKEHINKNLMADYEKDVNPYGSPENHPGFLGKLLHGLSVATGGPSRRAFQEQGLEKRLQDISKEESQEGLQGAQTKATEAEVPLRGAETHEAEARAKALENPPDKADKFTIQATDDGLFRIDNVTGEVQPVTFQGKPLNPFQKDVAPKGAEHVDVVGPDGKPMLANFHPDTGKYTDSTGKEIPNPRPYEKPNQAGMVTVIAPDPNTPGGGVVERLGAGAHIAPGSQTASQFGSVNTPTTQQRTAAGRAATVVAMAPEILGEIDRLGPSLGPVAGRWNDFMQGKVGMDNPEFAGLRTDLVMLSSAVALAHAVGRLPENLRQEFDHMINAPQQTPANIKATINHVLPWLQKMQEQGGRPGATPAGGGTEGPPPGAKVRDYTSLGGGK